MLTIHLEPLYEDGMRMSVAYAVPPPHWLIISAKIWLFPRATDETAFSPYQNALLFKLRVLGITKLRTYGPVNRGVFNARRRCARV